MQAVSTSRRTLVWAILVGPTVLGIWIYSRPGAPLVNRATRLVSTARWLQDYSGYFWVSDHEILAVEPQPGLVPVPGMRVGLGRSFTVARVDTNTGAETPNAALGRRMMGLRGSTGDWRISPRKDWLVTAFLRRNGQGFYGVSTDGEREMRWNSGASRGPWIRRPRSTISPLWMPDGRHWIEFRTGDARGVLTRVHSLGTDVVNGPTIVGPLTWPLCITSANRVLTVEGRLGGLDIIEYGLTPGAPDVHRASVRLDQNSRIAEAEPSPTGDRLAILTLSRSNSVVSQFMEYFEPGRQGLASERFTLWVCRSDGYGMHAVGTQRGGEIVGVQWTPDGKRLSFLCRNSLYTIPAE